MWLLCFCLPQSAHISTSPPCSFVSFIHIVCSYCVLHSERFPAPAAFLRPNLFCGLRFAVHGTGTPPKPRKVNKNCMLRRLVCRFCTQIRVKLRHRNCSAPPNRHKQGKNGGSKNRFALQVYCVNTVFILASSRLWQENRSLGNNCSIFNVIR